MKSKKNKLKHLKDQKKKKHIQAKFSTISILKDEIDKNRFDKKKSYKKFKNKRKRKGKRKKKAKHYELLL
jgi:hypothetical protein